MNLVSSNSEDTITINFKKHKLKLKPSHLSYSNIFGNFDNEDYNMAWMFLEALSGINLSMLESVVQNVVLAGGLWRVKGMNLYFKKKIKEYLPRFPKLEAWGLA